MNKVLQKLRSCQLQSPDRMLTMYLNTDSRDPDQQGGEWKIALKNGLTRINEYLEASSEDEHSRFNKIKDRIDQYIQELGKNMPRSLVIFASIDSQIWHCFQLQIPVETSFYWEERAMVSQLEKIYDAYPSTGVILTQQNEVKILDTSLGEINDIEHYLFDLESETWRKRDDQKKVQVTTGGAEKTPQKDIFKEREKDIQKRLYKSLGSKLDKKAADRKWKKIIIAGDKKTAEFIKSSMNKSIDETIQKNLLNEKESKVAEELLLKE
ncbi:VLRF1 family aeRF1-type release factor [Bacillus gobiensis]|uniref:VLRF1 family aeRF1-type release factor n=2 Tax=Bacillus gobiensis TaxID=1441095 RepID=UPI003D256A50